MLLADRYAERKKLIAQQAALLMEFGRNLMDEVKQVGRAAAGRFNRRFRRMKIKETEFRKDTLVLEYHWKRLEACYNAQTRNILLEYVGLVIGVVG